MTCVAVHSPSPRAVGMRRLLRPRAMAFRLVALADRNRGAAFGRVVDEKETAITIEIPADVSIDLNAT
jgi:hypothetical protein